MKKKWFEGKFRRNLVDMHIEDWNPEFMSKFDPQQYVANLKKANVQAAMVYSHSHVGLCNWPTKNGKMHAGLHGRDVMREIFDGCHCEGMDVILYYSLTFDNWAYNQYPEWRFKYMNGKYSREPQDKNKSDGSPKDYEFSGGRYGLLCPNSEGYKKFTVAQMKELCENYQFEGVFFDMTFWGYNICHCDSCKARYSGEIGGEIPRIMDWNDPAWNRLVTKREEWLLEFGKVATDAVKKFKPGCTVNHQYSTAKLDWSLGITELQRAISDYLGGDFYEDFQNQSFFCKYFLNTSPALPFEYHTSRYTGDQSSTKSKEELATMNYLTLAHQGATLFIDTVEPDGSLYPDCYETMGEVFRESQPYEKFIGGELLQDVAIYYSQDSKMDFADNGKAPKGGAMPHKTAARQAAETLGGAHIPYGVIGKCNLSQLARHQVLVLPAVLFLDDEEASAIRKFVKNGGSLYASGARAAKYLGDIFGITLKGESEQSICYLAPCAEKEDLLPGIYPSFPLILPEKCALVTSDGKGTVVGKIKFPHTDPADMSKFSSIHLNPSGIQTDYPAMVLRRYGKGRALWVAAGLEKEKKAIHRKCFEKIVRSLGPKQFRFEFDAPPAIEILTYHQPEQKRYLINFINTQEVLPAVPACKMKIFSRLDAGKKPRAYLLPKMKPLTMAAKEGGFQISLPEVKLFAMVAVDYA